MLDAIAFGFYLCIGVLLFFVACWLVMTLFVAVLSWFD